MELLGGSARRLPRQLLAELAMVNPTLLIAAQVGQSRPFDKSAVSHRVAVVWLLAAGASPELPGAGSVLLDQLYPRCQAHLRWSTATSLKTTRRSEPPVLHASAPGTATMTPSRERGSGWVSGTGLDGSQTS